MEPEPEVAVDPGRRRAVALGRGAAAVLGLEAGPEGVVVLGPGAADPGQRGVPEAADPEQRRVRRDEAAGARWRWPEYWMTQP